MTKACHKWVALVSNYAVSATCDDLVQVKMERTVVIEDAGAAQCRYRITGSVKVKMFGIGHLVEKQVMSNSVDSLGLLAQVVDRCASGT